jgi:hypothetical protein
MTMLNKGRLTTLLLVLTTGCGPNSDRAYRINVINHLSIPIKVQLGDLAFNVPANGKALAPRVDTVPEGSRFYVKDQKGKPIGTVQLSWAQSMRAYQGDTFTLDIPTSILQRAKTNAQTKAN